MIRFLLSILIILSALRSEGQITGTWEGDFRTRGTNFLNDPKLVVEIHQQNDSMIYGITHLYYEGNLYEHYKMIGKFRKRDSLIIFTEASTIAVDLGSLGNCLGTYMMRIKRQGDDYVATGNWVPNIKNCTSFSDVVLRMKVPPPPPKPPKKTAVVNKKPVPAPVNKKPATPVTKKPLPNAPAQKPIVRNNIPVQPAAPVPPAPAPVVKAPVILPPKVAQRQMDVQSLLEIPMRDKDSIKVEIYDNGEIDGDTVSVYVEEREVLSKKMITARPLTFYVSLNKNVQPITHIRLVAESLGTIPPCTALMIITTKSKRYEVRLASNYSKNGTVELFLKE